MGRPKDWKTEAFTSQRSAELSTLIYGTRSIYALAQDRVPDLFIRKIGQHCSLLQAEHYIVGFEI